jgi:hypothetical protein
LLNMPPPHRCASQGGFGRIAADDHVDWKRTTQGAKAPRGQHVILRSG